LLASVTFNNGDKIDKLWLQKLNVEIKARALNKLYHKGLYMYP